MSNDGRILFAGNPDQERLIFLCIYSIYPTKSHYLIYSTSCCIKIMASSAYFKACYILNPTFIFSLKSSYSACWIIQHPLYPWSKYNMLIVYVRMYHLEIYTCCMDFAIDMEPSTKRCVSYMYPVRAIVPQWDKWGKKGTLWYALVQRLWAVCAHAHTETVRAITMTLLQDVWGRKGKRRVVFGLVQEN